MSADPNTQPGNARQNGLARRTLRSASIVGAVWLVMGLFVSFAPGTYVIGDRDVTESVGIGMFVLVGAVLGAAIELIPAATDRLFARSR